VPAAYHAMAGTANPAAHKLNAVIFGKSSRTLSETFLLAREAHGKSIGSSQYRL